MAKKMEPIIELYDDKIIVEYPHQGKPSAYMASPDKILSLAFEECSNTGNSLAHWAYDNNIEKYPAPPEGSPDYWAGELEELPKGYDEWERKALENLDICLQYLAHDLRRMDVLESIEEAEEYVKAEHEGSSAVLKLCFEEEV